LSTTGGSKNLSNSALALSCSTALGPSCVRLRYTSIAHGSSESMCDKASIGIPGAVDKFRRFALTTSSKEYRGLKSAIAEMMDFT